MTPRRAFWEALATVLLPSVVIWGVLLCIVYEQSPQPDQIGSYLLFFFFFALLPFPLAFPIYRRYRDGVSIQQQANLRTPGQQFVLAAVFAVAGVAYLIDAVSYHRNRWDLLFKVTMVVFWFLMAANHARSGVKARNERNSPST